MRLVGESLLAQHDIPEYNLLHPYISVSHIVPYFVQPAEFTTLRPLLPPHTLGPQREELFVVNKILNHRRRGCGYQFLTLVKGTPHHHHAEGQPARDFIGQDSTSSQALLLYSER